MQISRTPLSCSLRKKIYGTYPIGGTFDPDISPASTPHPPITSVFLFLYILQLRSCRLPSVFIRRPCLPSLPEKLRNSWVPSLPGSYPSSSLLQTLPPPSRLPSFSRFSRLGRTCSKVFRPRSNGSSTSQDIIPLALTYPNWCDR